MKRIGKTMKAGGICSHESMTERLELLKALKETRKRNHLEWQNEQAEEGQRARRARIDTHAEINVY